MSETKKKVYKRKNKINAEQQTDMKEMHNAEQQTGVPVESVVPVVPVESVVPVVFNVPVESDIVKEIHIDRQQNTKKRTSCCIIF